MTAIFPEGLKTAMARCGSATALYMMELGATEILWDEIKECVSIADHADSRDFNQRMSREAEG